MPELDDRSALCEAYLLLVKRLFAALYKDVASGEPAARDKFAKGLRDAREARALAQEVLIEQQ